MLKDRQEGKVAIVSPTVRIAMMELLRPSVFLLHTAGWRAGFTVNGTPASFYR